MLPLEIACTGSRNEPKHRRAIPRAVAPLEISDEARPKTATPRSPHRRMTEKAGAVAAISAGALVGVARPAEFAAGLTYVILRRLPLPKSRILSRCRRTVVQACSVVSHDRTVAA
jgi:hypothetical protein